MCLARGICARTCCARGCHLVLALVLVVSCPWMGGGFITLCVWGYPLLTNSSNMQARNGEKVMVFRFLPKISEHVSFVFEVECDKI